MTSFFLEIVDRSITASYLIIVVMLLRPVLNKVPKWIRGILWGLVGIRLVIPISFESIFSLIPDKSPLPALNHLQETLGTDGGKLPPISDFSTNAATAPQNMDVIGTMTHASETIHTWNVSIADITAIIWLTGMVAMLVYCIVSYIRLNKQVSDAVLYQNSKYAIFQSEKVTSPFVLGIFNPHIYLPYHMEPADMDCVIAHEKAHIARRDHLTKPLSFAILSFYWFNPFVWLAYILLCRDIELACDEKVIKEMGKGYKKQYSEALFKCSVSARMISACPLAFGEVGVKKRIVNVLHYKKPGFWIIIVSLILCVVVAVCFLTNPKEEKKEETQLSEQEVQNQVNQLQEELEKQYLQEKLKRQAVVEEIEKQEILRLDALAQIPKEPPIMTLQDTLSSTINPIYVKYNNYNWTYPTGNADEMITVDELGEFATVAVKGKQDEWIQVTDYNGIDYAPYMASFDMKPDRIQVIEYDLLELGDMKPQALSEKMLEDVYLLELKPRRIYEINAAWDEGSNESGFYGQASYIFATDNYAL